MVVERPLFDASGRSVSVISDEPVP